MLKYSKVGHAAYQIKVLKETKIVMYKQLFCDFTDCKPAAKIVHFQCIILNCKKFYI